jgi:hypothetical protein
MTTLLARKPKGFVANRLHALIAFVLDTRVRIDEASPCGWARSSAVLLLRARRLSTRVRGGKPVSGLSAALTVQSGNGS